MNALVLGYGRSGKAAEALLGDLGFSVTVLDGEAPFPDGKYAMAVVSPGISLAHPWVMACRERGIALRSELQLGCEELKRRGWKLLAVTGSKGKSSVVKVVADAINRSGRYAVACGNYGVPVCEVLGSSRRTVEQSSVSPWAVVEVSSFMMETTDLPGDTFEAAAILNLQEDHLDRHGSVAVYHGLKRRLLTMAKVGLGPSRQEPDRYDGKAGFPWAGSYFDNEILAANAAMAAGLMRVVGLDDDAVRCAFAEFEPLPHRMNLVVERDGVRYVDDSKATSLTALAAGVKMAAGGRRSVRLIAGGLPKGDDPKSVGELLTECVKKVYLIGRSAEAFAAVWSKSADCEVCETMDRAVAAAKREAEKGETVLLSPGTASFDQFENFGERGDVFAELVQKQG